MHLTIVLPQTARCDHLCLISREGKDAPFVIKYIVCLGNGRYERNTDVRLVGVVLGVGRR